ncbi:hypothetical protein QAD02_017176 [Eretmocerus hayati]|uniref:Uncharacterized protein n=1 Tax=Eretmocerus hayati TaxID=131215 RepID=A0ACC2PDK4_9HYME|nr:hypothetical protein QAD02_017176 [Eretmocerus hayati]
MAKRQVVWALCSLSLCTLVISTNSEPVTMKKDDILAVGYEDNPWSFGHWKVEEQYYLESAPNSARNEDWVTYAFNSTHNKSNDKQFRKIVTIRVKKPEDEELAPERVALVAGGPEQRYMTLYFRSKPGRKINVTIETWVHEDLWLTHSV